MSKMEFVYKWRHDHKESILQLQYYVLKSVKICQKLRDVIFGRPFTWTPNRRYPSCTKAKYMMKNMTEKPPKSFAA